MSATNHTANYNLPQFIGSDKPAWLVDFNGAMADIDAAIYAAKSQADATDLVVTGHTSAIEALQTTESDQGTAITGLRTDVDGNTGSINTINSLIGNGEPTTTDKTIIGAINELHDDVTDVSSKITVRAFNVNACSIMADGIKTYAEMLNDLETAFAAYVTGLVNVRPVIEYVEIQTIGKFIPQGHQDVILNGTYGNLGTNGSRSLNYTIQHISAGWRMSSDEIASDSTVTHTNMTNQVPTQGITFSVKTMEYNIPD